MNEYIRPNVIRTYSIAELRADAASCSVYEVDISDRVLKRDLEMVEQPLERLREISRD